MSTRCRSRERTPQSDEIIQAIKGLDFAQAPDEVTGATASAQGRMHDVAG